MKPRKLIEFILTRMGLFTSVEIFLTQTASFRFIYSTNKCNLELCSTQRFKGLRIGTGQVWLKGEYALCRA